MLALKFNPEAEKPKFKNLSLNLEEYTEGLTIIRSAQCPYSVKNVDAILNTARNKMKIKANLIDLKEANEAQQTPCAFGTFCIIIMVRFSVIIQSAIPGLKTL